MGLALIPNAEVPADLQAKNPDYLVMHGRLQVGRICKRQITLSGEAQWLWGINGVYGGPELMLRSGATASIEEAKDKVKENWGRWLGWANLAEAGGSIDWGRSLNT